MSCQTYLILGSIMLQFLHFNLETTISKKAEYMTYSARFSILKIQII